MWSSGTRARLSTIGRAANKSYYGLQYHSRAFGAGAAVPCSLESLRTPCPIVRRSVVQANTTNMLARAAKLGVELRPHVKTHKTVEGALLQTGGRRSKITASTLAEVEFFVGHGFDDIIYAMPITSDKLPQVGALLKQGATVHVCVDHADQLAAVVERAKANDGAERWSVVIMVDCGMHRDGVSADADDPLVEDLAVTAANARWVTLFGCYTHGGHSYTTDGIDAVRRVGVAERDAVVEVSRRVKAATGIQLPSIGVGSTPTSSNPPEHLNGVTEMHPGNYIFYDTMQASYGSNTHADIGMFTLTRVVGHYPRSNTLLIDLGWTGCSKQGPEQNFGKLLDEPNLYVRNLKQEAGEVTTFDAAPIDFSDYPIGKFLRLLPWHSCAVSHQHNALYVVDDDNGPVVDVWSRARGW